MGVRMRTSFRIISNLLKWIKLERRTDPDPDYPPCRYILYYSLFRDNCFNDFSISPMSFSIDNFFLQWLEWFIERGKFIDLQLFSMSIFNFDLNPMEFETEKCILGWCHGFVVLCEVSFQYIIPLNVIWLLVSFSLLIYTMDVGASRHLRQNDHHHKTYDFLVWW